MAMTSIAVVSIQVSPCLPARPRAWSWSATILYFESQDTLQEAMTSSEGQDTLGAI